MDLNLTTLTGRLTKDAEMTFTQSGKSIAKFSIAVGGFKKEETHFFNCIKWNAENIISYLTKGKKIGISGELQQQKWNDNQGQAQSRIIINVNTLVLLDSTQTNPSQGFIPPNNTQPPQNNTQPPRNQPPANYVQQTAQNVPNAFNGQQQSVPFNDPWTNQNNNDDDIEF